MNETNHKQRALLLGILIGGSLGFMESIIASRLWHAFGSPDFLFHSGRHDVHMIMNTTAGVVFGLIFGIIVRHMSRRRASPIRFMPFYLSLMLSGFLLFA